MLFSLFFALAIIILFIFIIIFFMRLGYIAIVIIDVFLISGVAIYYAHHQWFIHIASGKAVYFWDVILFVAIIFTYSTLIMAGTNKFPAIAGIFHYMIAWIITYFIHGMINVAIFGEIGSLLNHNVMNTIVHVIIISILAIFIFNTRMRIFNK